MTRLTTDPIALWRAIETAGSIQNYVDAQLREHGWLIERRDTDSMSKSQLEAYKKQLKQEAVEKRRLNKDAWLAYKSRHIVHLGEGVYWNDGDDYDKWDLENAEERAAENNLPPFDKPAQLAEALGLTVAITDKNGAGELKISYRTLEQLDDLVRRLRGGF